MADDFIDLKSVNWAPGMFLTPDHFLRQERYIDSMWMWLLRYGSASYGLVGAGPRIEPNERGAARFDPVIAVEDSDQTLKVTVLQCRGITGGGCIVDVDPSRPLDASFTRASLEGSSELGVFVVARPHDKEGDASIADPVNPQATAARRFKYSVELDVRADDAQWSLLVARLRKAQTGLRFEKIAAFIPPCALMTAHSELMHVFRQINERTAALADRYSALHRAIVEFVGLAKSRGLDVDQDAETLAFVGRMVVALEAGTCELLDPLQPPRRFFQQVNRLVRSAALFLSLSAPTREYFRQLGDMGEIEFVTLLEQERQALDMDRQGVVQDSLGTEAQKCLRALERIDRLERALEGKYLDFRVSPSLEGINFVFDRTTGEPVLYKTVAKPARPMAHGQELTFVFAPLRLETRDQFRVILMGDRSAMFEPGDRMTIEIRINPGEGYQHAAEYATQTFEVDGQVNFAFDFKAAADVPVLTDLRISVRSSQPMRGAILYVRSRLRAGLGPIAEPVLLPRTPVRPVDRASATEDQPPPTPTPRRRLS